MTTPLVIRPVRATDVRALADLNDGAVPAVNALGAAGLAAHLPTCDVTLVVDGTGETDDDVGPAARSAPGVPVAFVLTCEVNLEPPNPHSLAFHHRLGFTQVGEQVTTRGTVRVALLVRPVGSR